MTPKTVYVVMASEGEYSSRVVWVSAVYTDKATAIQMAEQKLRQSKNDAFQRDCWLNRASAIQPPIDMPNHGTSAEARAVYRAWIEKLGPEPQGAEADDFTVVEVPLNTWGQWETVT